MKRDRLANRFFQFFKIGVCSAVLIAVVGAVFIGEHPAVYATILFTIAVTALFFGGHQVIGCVDEYRYYRRKVRQWRKSAPTRSWFRIVAEVSVGVSGELLGLALAVAIFGYAVWYTIWAVGELVRWMRA
jgi:heme O synthase-like polyprenyltransferase